MTPPRKYSLHRSLDSIITIHTAVVRSWEISGVRSMPEDHRCLFSKISSLSSFSTLRVNSTSRVCSNIRTIMIYLTAPQYRWCIKTIHSITAMMPPQASWVLIPPELGFKILRNWSLIYRLSPPNMLWDQSRLKTVVLNIKKFCVFSRMP